MADLFLSHVEKDQAAALEIAYALEAEGYSIWYYERDSLPGLTYVQQIVQAIEQAQATILLVTPACLRSVQVDREVVNAFERGKRIVPVLQGISYGEFKQ